MNGNAANHAMLHTPALLIIMDGYGIAPATPGNAITAAQKPCLDALFSQYPTVAIEASGEAVGLPHGQMGNSEVGHLNIGAGRVVFQELTRIDRACQDGSLATNSRVRSAIEVARKPGAVLHLMGLVSDGGVHSSNEHLYALMGIAAQAGVSHVHIHCFMDGRDVPPTSGADYVKQLEDRIAQLSTPHCRIEIASVSGRYYAMDRDNRWGRIEKAYDALTSCAPRAAGDAAAFIHASYDHDVTDEFIVPASFTERGIQDQDAVVFFNFRPDRARQITRAFTECEFTGFDRHVVVHPHFVCLTEYDPSIDAQVVFPKEFPERVLADVLAEAGLRQFHIAETEKYAHVTFFLNGGRETPKTGEERSLIPSPKVATYDLQPQMSEPEVAATLVQAIDDDAADVYIVNFANCDMVGHTGSVPAAVQAVQAVDAGVAQVLAAIERKGGVALVTADHGNADKMVAEDGQPFTAHTTNPVPFTAVDFSGAGMRLDASAAGALCDVAPTLLAMIGLPQPVEMTGTSLLER